MLRVADSILEQKKYLYGVQILRSGLDVCIWRFYTELTVQEKP